MDFMHSDVDAEGSLVDQDEKMSELSAAFYAAASAVSRFNKQCALEEKRHCAAGYTKMMSTIVEHIKAQAFGGQIAASVIVSFLRRQLVQLPVHQVNVFSSGDSKPAAGDDIQACRFQTAAAALAEMQIHSRQAQKRNVVSGARQAVEFVARNLLPLEGQIVQEAVLLNFLASHTQQQNESLGAPAAGDSSVHSRLPGPAARQATHNGATASLQRGGDGSSPAQVGKLGKRSHDSMSGIHLDPAFEQVFKRQCQPPPTPPRLLSSALSRR